MATKTVTQKVVENTCERCEHTWKQNDPANPPRVCPKCKSPYWNRPRQTKAAKKK